MGLNLNFSVFERAGRKGWWYQYYDSDGVRSSALSVATLMDRAGLRGAFPLKTKRQAERAVMLAYERGFVGTSEPSEQPLTEYLMDYWDFKGDRIRRKNRLSKGRGISENYAFVMQGYIRNHIAPLVGDSALGDVTSIFVKNIYDSLIDSGELANATIAKIMTAFMSPLKEALRNNLIFGDPSRLIDSIDTTPDKPRGILTQDEFARLLEVLKREGDERVYLAVLLASATGMRQGEIRALKTDDIEVINESDALVSITKSWATYGGEKGTKGKKDRLAPCPAWLANRLLELGAKNPHGNDLIFYSEKSDSPISSPFLRKGYYDALYCVLLSKEGKPSPSLAKCSSERLWRAEKIRQQRNIVFHSLRHYFTTTAQTLGVDGDLLRYTVGHESQAMTDAYTHSSYDLVKSVAQVSRQIIGEEE